MDGKGYDAFSVDEKRRICWLVRAWRDAMLVGNRAPAVTEAWERHSNPQPGDWVVEASTMGFLLRGRTTAYGNDLATAWDGQVTRFLRTEERFTPYGEEEDEDGGFTEKVWICENPDGTTYTWTNAELVTVPLNGPLVK